MVFFYYTHPQHWWTCSLDNSNVNLISLLFTLVLTSNHKQMKLSLPTNQITFLKLEINTNYDRHWCYICNWPHWFTDGQSSSFSENIDGDPHPLTTQILPCIIHPSPFSVIYRNLLTQHSSSSKPWHPLKSTEITTQRSSNIPQTKLYASVIIEFHLFTSTNVWARMISIKLLQN